MNVLSVSGIYRKDETGFELKNIHFSLQRFQKLAIAGETGSGKSTLLKIIAGLAQADSGEVLFEGERVVGPHEKLIPGHKEIAYLSQHFQLRNSYRIEEELSYLNKLSDSEAEAIYEVCQIDHLLKRWTTQVSGGERQRIALARLLVSSPKLLLLDEPFSNLDLIHKNILKSVIHDIGEKLGITCMLVSHDAIDVLSWADKIIVMKNGEIIEQGSPQKIYQTPGSEYVAGLFGKYNLLPVHLFKDNISLNGKRIFLRPEQLQITKEAENAEATITAIRFAGSYNEIDLSLPENTITVLSPAQNSFKVGDAVKVSLGDTSLWYM
ncbi:MAG: ABC transporter ATP-binding protein [Agriterribacter sp.]